MVGIPHSHPLKLAQRLRFGEIIGARRDMGRVELQVDHPWNDQSESWRLHVGPDQYFVRLGCEAI